MLINTCLLLALAPVLGQGFFKPAAAYNPQRATGIIVTESIAGAAITVGLNYLWYRKFPHSRFHYFNDNNEWLNMDKVGHATTTYNISAGQNDLLRWAGVKPGKAAVIGSLTALAFMTMVEIMDGHSSKYGFSKGDMLANIAGCVLFEGQQLLWKEQRMGLKFSYHATIFPQYYPDELGRKLQQKILKDYNGQTYWLSMNIASFLPQASGFPRWLNLAAGYGAEGMIGAVKNPAEINGRKIPDFTRYRQFYVSFDTDLYRIKNLGPGAATLLSLNRIIKMPAPAYEWNSVQRGIFHWLYF